MIEDKYMDKLSSGIITLDNEIEKLQKSINDNNDKIVDLMKQIKDLDKDKDIHETISLNKNSNQLRHYNNLVVKFKRQEIKKQLDKLQLDLKLETHKQQRLKNEKKQKEQILLIQKKKQFQQQKNYKRLFGQLKEQELKRQENKSKLEKRLLEQETKRLKNMPSIKFGTKAELEKELENLKKSFEKYRKDKEVIFPVIEKNNKEQINKPIKEDLFKKQKNEAKRFVEFDKYTDNRCQMYRWRFDLNGNPLKIEEHKEPLWKKIAKIGFPPLGKIKNTNSSNKNNLQNK